MIETQGIKPWGPFVWREKRPVERAKCRGDGSRGRSGTTSRLGWCRQSPLEDRSTWPASLVSGTLGECTPPYLRG
jgi:hypothetical protein